ncbi:MAG: hypothetical protein IPJ65_22305 [Archangiaceae bacterium]|nr:hypothetical protein [Archangiaceae bacterium]
MSSAAKLEDALDALYAVAPDAFMAKRDALAKELKDAGEKEAAATVKKQHKPTLVAHALNRLSREARHELDALFQIGKALASGRDFKAAVEKQRAAVEDLRKKASGPDVPALIAVVQGALVDPALAEAVKAGRFSKLPEAPVGFFGAAPEGAPAVVHPPPKKSAPAPPPPPPSPPKPRGPAPELLAALKAAESEAAAAADEVSTLERELAEAKRRAHQAAEQVKKLQKQVDAER